MVDDSFEEELEERNPFGILGDGVQTISVTYRKVLLCGSLNMWYPIEKCPAPRMATIHGWTLTITPDVSLK